MDNDTIELDCQWAEDELSGYLDDVLDPQLRRRVEAHLATCERCRTILEDYRRADDLMRDLPFIEPPSDMRERFFNSPEYLKLANVRARQRNFVTPLSAALVAAALLVVALGGALLIRHGFAGQQTAGKPGATAVIGNNGGGGPLAAGFRLIYERGGALWSAPESGAGLPARLTPAGVQVLGWRVSPNGHMVIYIDTSTGALHSIRADGLSDKAIGTVTGGKALSTGFWTTPAGAAIAQGVAWSPDNTRVAYLAQSADGGTTLHVMNAAGSADATVNSTGSGLIGHLLWSADSVYIAYTSTSQTGAQSVCAYNVTTGHARSLASQSNADDSAAVVGRLAWLPSGASATVTWSASDADKVTGVFRAGVNTSAAATRLTPPGNSYAAADVSSSGAWLLANGSTLWEITASQTSPHVVAALVNQIAQVHWSPSATMAAVVSGDSLILVTPGQTPVVVAHGLTARSQVAWSPKSDALAWQAGQAVLSASVRNNGAVGAAKTVAANANANANANALVWAPDGQSLAVRSSTGLLLVTADGAHVRASDSNAAGDGQFAWSIAG